MIEIETLVVTVDLRLRKLLTGAAIDVIFSLNYIDLKNMIPYPPQRLDQLKLHSTLVYK